MSTEFLKEALPSFRTLQDDSALQHRLWSLVEVPACVQCLKDWHEHYSAGIPGEFGADVRNSAVTAQVDFGAQTEVFKLLNSAECVLRLVLFHRDVSSFYLKGCSPPIYRHSVSKSRLGIYN